MPNPGVVFVLVWVAVAVGGGWFLAWGALRLGKWTDGVALRAQVRANERAAVQAAKRLGEENLRLRRAIEEARKELRKMKFTANGAASNAQTILAVALREGGES